MTDGRIPEEQAQRIWRRAAELQALAAERAELRRRASAIGSLAQPGLTLEDIRHAAIEAGIGDEFIESAMAELEGEQDVEPPPGSWLSRSADRLLDRPPRILTVAREIPASPDVVFEAMQRIFPAPPFDLLLRDTRGADLFTDGVFLFECAAGSMRTAFQRKLGAGSVTRLFVTLRPVREDADRCDVTIRAPTGRIRLHVALSGSFTGVGAGSGAAAGAAVGPNLALLLGAGGIVYTSILGAAAIVTGFAAGGLVLSGYRALHSHALRRAADGLESLVQALTVDVRTRDVLTQRSTRAIASSG